MARILAVGFLLWSTALVALGQPASDRTADLCNGRWWSKAPVDARLGYIVGYAEQLTSSGNCGKEEWFTAVPAVTEVKAAIDAFYLEPANAAVPVKEAMTIVAMKFNGKTAAEIERRTDDARKLAAELGRKR